MSQFVTCVVTHISGRCRKLFWNAPTTPCFCT